MFVVGAALWWRPDLPIRPWFYGGLAASAAGGVLLLALLIRIRIMLAHEPV